MKDKQIRFSHLTYQYISYQILHSTVTQSDRCSQPSTLGGYWPNVSYIACKLTMFWLVTWGALIHSHLRMRTWASSYPYTAAFFMQPTPCQQLKAAPRLCHSLDMLFSTFSWAERISALIDKRVRNVSCCTAASTGKHKQRKTNSHSILVKSLRIAQVRPTVHNGTTVSHDLATVPQPKKANPLVIQEGNEQRPQGNSMSCQHIHLLHLWNTY